MHHNHFNCTIDITAIVEPPTNISNNSSIVEIPDSLFVDRQPDCGLHGGNVNILNCEWIPNSFPGVCTF